MSGVPVPELLSIVLTTSPIAAHPSTSLVETVLRSFAHVPGLFRCRLVIVCDGCKVGAKPKYKSGVVTDDAAARYREYIARLRCLARDGALGRMAAAGAGLDGAVGGSDSRAGAGGSLGFPAAQVHIEELPQRMGFGLAVQAALRLCPPGWGWEAPVERAPPQGTGAGAGGGREAVTARHPIRYIGLLSGSTLKYAEKVRSRFGTRLSRRVVQLSSGGGDGDDGGNDDGDGAGGSSVCLLPLLFWFDKTHICEVEHYHRAVFCAEYELDDDEATPLGMRRQGLRVAAGRGYRGLCVKRGDFIEDTLGKKMLEEIQQHGLGRHARYGTWLLLPAAIADAPSGPAAPALARGEEARREASAVVIRHLNGRKFEERRHARRNHNTQTSHGACVYGSTFGCADETQMWVKNCSGTFTCGSSGQAVRCESVHFARAICICAAPAPTPPPGPIIGGSGLWRWQYMPELLQLPAGTEVQHAHGLERDADGNIYLNYVNWNNGIQTNGTDQHCLVRWAPDGTSGRFVEAGGSALCAGTPHGLTLARESGELFFYHANCGTEPARYGSGKLSKTALNGTVLWQHEGNFGQPAGVNYRPTWWAVPPAGDFVYLGDGYGSSNVYVFSRGGRFQNTTFGGKGSQHGRFNNCHGVHHDPRTDKLLVADRENHRIELYDVDDSGATFRYNSTVTLAWGQAGTQRPCNVRVLQGAANASLDGLAVVADLGADDQSQPGAALGQVAVLDGRNRLLADIAVSRLLGHQGSVHPHDAIFLPNGDIVVATWNPGRVSYWKLL
eukprot:g485.t1